MTRAHLTLFAPLFCAACTTDGDPLAQITFVNVTAGEVALSLTVPDHIDDYAWYRGDLPVEDWQPILETDRVNGMFIVCYGS